MFWNKKVATIEKKQRAWKELLRENLGTITIDSFYIDDPVFKMTPEDRKMYLKHFLELSQDAKLIERIKYLINKQANLTLKGMKDKDDEVSNMAGAMNINGLGLLKDDIEKLAEMYLKENVPKEELKGLDRFKVT